MHPGEQDGRGANRYKPRPENGGFGTTPQVRCSGILPRSGERRRRRRCLKTNEISKAIYGPPKGSPHIYGEALDGSQLQKLHISRFLKKVQTLFRLSLRLFALRDGGTERTGMLAIKGRLEGIGHRTRNGARNEHPRPRRCLQHSPVRTTEIECAAEDQEFVQRRPHGVLFFKVRVASPSSQGT